jgi:MPBQ/MSBQ methyltransferase
MTNLGDMMLAALQPMGRNIEAWTPADLAPIDAFHIRGPESTQEFAAHAKVRPERAVLGVGSSLGGSARYLAVEYRCRVTGLDLTHAFCDIAIMLLPRLGLSHRTVFLQDSAVAMPFADSSFDLVWTEHAQMNIADKARFCGEIRGTSSENRSPKMAPSFSLACPYIRVRCPVRDRAIGDVRL